MANKDPPNAKFVLPIIELAKKGNNYSVPLQDFGLTLSFV